MTRLKVMTVIGTRPEAVKLAPVVLALQAHADQFDSVVAVTGQHRQMLDSVLQHFGIRPHHDLDIMQSGQTLTDVTSRVLSGLAPIYAAEKPDLVLVQGDTTTVFAATLAAYYQRLKVGHVEAGLRTGDKYQPFPEEANRRMVSHLADWHFCPTTQARHNLLNEGIDPQTIFVTGNTVIDALLATVDPDYQFTQPPLGDLDFRSQRVLLVTAHRRENWGEPIHHLCLALRQIVATYADVTIVFATHLNPIVQDAVRADLADTPRIHLLNPLDYAPFVQLMARCQLILTDSGGVQEEAPSLGKPVLVLRNVTERPEGVDAGVLRVIGTDTATIVAHVNELLTDAAAYARMAQASNPYGDGHAAQRIVEALRVCEDCMNGLTIHVVGAQKANAPWGFECKIIDTLHHMGHTVISTDFRLERAALRQRLQHPADLILVNKGEWIPPQWFEDLSAPAVLWYAEFIGAPGDPIDDATQRNRALLAYNAHAFDAVFVHDERSLSVAKGLGAKAVGWFPTAAVDPGVHCKEAMAQTVDLLFIGGMTPRRRAILDQLARTVELTAEEIRDPVAMNRRFNQARIVLNIHAGEVLNTETRVCEVLGAGAFLLTEELSSPQLFQEGVHVAVWPQGRVDLLEEKVRYYLEHSAERQSIADAGHAYAHSHHTLRQRLTQLLAALDLAPGKAAPFQIRPNVESAPITLSLALRWWGRGERAKLGARRWGVHRPRWLRSRNRRP